MPIFCRNKFRSAEILNPIFTSSEQNDKRSSENIDRKINKTNKVRVQYNNR